MISAKGNLKESRISWATNLVVQVGLVVHDIDATRENTPISGPGGPAGDRQRTSRGARTQYRGAPTRPRQARLFNVGPTLTLELIEPDHGPSTWREELDKKGEGVHHLAFIVEGWARRSPR